MSKPASSNELAKDPYRIVSAEFLAGAAPGSALPAPTLAEVAFAGRSNVGKSSLVNKLVGRRGLVRTSSTPGSTRQLNLYSARSADGTTLQFVDLPGYGFSRRSKSERTAWGVLIEDYLTTRVTLAAVVLIVDIRRGLEEDDRELLTFIETKSPASRRPVEAILVATKLDKEPSSRRKTALVAVEKSAGRKVIGFSAETGEGRDVLLRAIRRAALGTVPWVPEAPPLDQAGLGGPPIPPVTMGAPPMPPVTMGDPPMPPVTMADTPIPPSGL